MGRIRANVVVGVIGVIAVLALAGCATALADPADITDAPSVSSSSSPTSTVSPSDSVDPDDPSTWLIDFSGVGPIAVGSPIAGFTVPSPYVDVSDSTNCPGVPTFAADDHPYFAAVALTSPADIGEIVIGRNGRAPSATLLASSPKTAEGIGIGSAPADVVAAYPDAVVTPGLQGNTTYAISQGGVNIAILVEEGTADVTRIIIGGGTVADYPICTGD